MTKTASALMLGTMCLAIAACSVEKTKDGKLPDVNVSATAGELPEYNVEGPDVKVGTKNETVQVPTVDVDLPKDKK